MEDKILEKYLPLGTIVFLKNDIVMHMIVGYLVTDKGNKTSDYISIPFPYGLMSTEALFPFNHDDIEEIIFEGYKTETFSKLDNYLKDYESKNRKD